MDFFPFLRKVPDFLLTVKREAKKLHQREITLFRDHYFETRRKLQKGTAKVRTPALFPFPSDTHTRKLPQPCVCVDLVKLQKEESFSDDLAAYIGGSLLQAGSETTAGVLVGFIQAITIFPSVARIAQAEIDGVCGNRLPDLNDVPDLPYVRACAKETLRWMPGFLLGLPHAATRDDVYLGYRIPNKATILMNVWYGLLAIGRKIMQLI